MFSKIIIPSRPIIKYRSIVRSISLSTTNYRIANDSNAVYIFDRYTKSLQRERASAAQDVNLYDYLKDEVGYRIADRVFDIKRKFTLAADIGILTLVYIINYNEKHILLCMQILLAGQFNGSVNKIERMY